jgi:hypothetical protein
VARYDKQHKQTTRQRIVEAAGRRFKQDGIDGAGLATLMFRRPASLTAPATPTSSPNKISSPTCSPTSYAPNGKASTPGRRLGPD